MIEETKDYWISGSKIIFKPEFNKPLDEFYELISKYNELIFSDYNDLNTLLKTINCDFKNSRLHFKPSKFNQPIILGNNLKIIIFGICFNQPIILNDNLRELRFGSYFNHPIILNDNLRELSFGSCFNHPIILPKKLVSLCLGRKFNESIIFGNELTILHLGTSFDKSINIPDTVKRLKLFCNNQYIVDSLPNNIIFLQLCLTFNLEINNLPNSIKKLKISKYDKDLNNLPNSIKRLELPSDYLLQIKKLPSNLKTIKCSKDYEFVKDFEGFNVEFF
jgi:hypothetical protein